MDLFIEVNGKKVNAQRGETILDVLRRNGISIPTLCHIPGLSPTGSCRICVVEVEGRDEFLPSCSQRVEAGMSIRTHTPGLLSARKAIIEMLLANHKGECLHCSRNGDCELQQLGATFNISERRYPYTQRQKGKDTSSEGLQVDHNKCILCQRCVRICGDLMGVFALDVAGRGSSTRMTTLLDKGLNLSSCIQCGQCTLVCPTGALQSKDELDQVIRSLSDTASQPVIGLSAISAISVGEALGMRPGRDLSGVLSTALRLIGFKKVFDTTAGNELYLQLTTRLLEERIRRNVKGPLFSSCCPAWVRMASHNLTDLPGELSPVSGPASLMTLLASRSAGEPGKEGKQPITYVNIDPCTARRMESMQEENLHTDLPVQGYFLNSRDLARLINLYGLDLEMMQEQPMDDLLEQGSYSGRLCGISGGTVEMLASALEERFNGKASSERKTRKLRSNRWFKEIIVKLDGQEYALIAVNGTGRIQEALEEVRHRKNVLFVEVMACPGGCLFGGGQVVVKDDLRSRARHKALTDAHSLYERSALGETNALAAFTRLLSQEEQISLYSRWFRGKEEV